MIAEIKSSQSAQSAQPAQTASAQARTNLTKTAAAQQEAAKATDTVELGSSQHTSATYSKTNKLSATDIQTIKNAADQAYANLRALVEQMLKGQGKASTKASSSQDSGLDEVEQAKLAISEDGDFGVKAVSDRIVQFAVAVSGGDKAKYEQLKAAIDKGFQQAAKSLGGELPGISQQTYKEVMRKLDEWKNSNDTET